MKKIAKSGKSRLPLSSIILYIASVITFLIAAASLVNNITLFKENLNQYLQQGYPYAEVFNVLLKNQLLPGIFEPIAVYLSMALTLFAAGLINQKVTKLVNLRVNPDTLEDNETKETKETAKVIEDNAEVINDDAVSTAKGITKTEAFE
ncbi:MAG: hypothetical protein PHZ11_02685 [Desulfitobacteriaceae bacterium]|nr:hypothetical protein [Desulfitobacteriaceae bacterium]MDD4345800.1 hypothetical protein [Desulfitobacteriaceae bacterium]